uniref:WRKY transcription factor 50 n=1 Tax=Rhizophora mucronata TaxID=61149 RepID=A0A2P2N4L9_RHIMU
MVLPKIPAPQYGVIILMKGMKLLKGELKIRMKQDCLLIQLIIVKLQHLMVLLGMGQLLRVLESLKTLVALVLNVMKLAGELRKMTMNL